MNGEQGVATRERGHWDGDNNTEAECQFLAQELRDDMEE
jgi:hypothetical protein